MSYRPRRQPRSVRWESGPPLGLSVYADARDDTVRGTDGTRVMIEAVARDGRAAGVEFRLRLETVEIWHHERCCAVLDRDYLRDWLAAPGQEIVVDDFALSLDRGLDRDGRISISLPDVLVWGLSDVEILELRKRV